MDQDITTPALCPDTPHQHIRVEFEDVDTGKDGMIIEAGETKDGNWMVEQVHLPLNDPGAISDIVQQIRKSGAEVDLGDFEKQLQQLPTQKSDYQYTDDDEELGGFYI